MNIIYGYIGNKAKTNIGCISQRLEAEGGVYKEKKSNNFHFGNVCFNTQYPLTISESNTLVVCCDCLLTNKEKLCNNLNINTDINDADLIIKSYNKWGENIVKHLEGDFAITIFNKESGETILIRDHLGIKPLYYHIDSRGLFFTGNYHLLVDNKIVSPSFSAKSLCLQLEIVRGENYPNTPFDNIFRIKPATYLKFIPNNRSYKVKEVCYWNPKKDIRINKNRSLTQTIREFEEVIHKAIAQRSKEDKIGVHLSGGIDSSTVACKLSQLKNKTIKAYSWSPSPQNVHRYIDPKGKPEEFGEYKIINSLCKKYTFDLSYSDYEPKDFYNYLSRPDYFLQPVLEIPVTEKIKKDGINLMLSGWGGDEFFSFKNSIIWLEYFICFKGLFRIPYFLIKQPKETLSKLKRHATLILLPRPIKKYRIKKIADKDNLIKDKRTVKKFYRDKKDYIYNLFMYTKNDTMQKRLDLNYLSIRTEVWNQHGYRHGTEYSFPLLDKNLIEFMFSIPSKQMISKKYKRFLVRLACRNLLPKDILRNRLKNEHGRINMSAFCVNNNKEHVIKKLKEIKNHRMLNDIDIDKAIKKIENNNNLVNGDILTGIRIIRIYNFATKYAKQ